MAQCERQTPSVEAVSNASDLFDRVAQRMRLLPALLLLVASAHNNLARITVLTLHLTINYV